MLTSLRIRNLALVVDLTLEFQPGFNAITGETGAGKSILIGALNLLLGDRADRTLLRAGADACTVEGVFDVRGLRAVIADFLANQGLEGSTDDSLFIKRSFTAGGTNRQFINGSPASVQILAALGEWLVDIHGPHDHQSLFQPARQLHFLDAHAGLTASRTALQVLFDQRNALVTEKASLIVDEQTYTREVDLLRHQVGEIDAARLGPGDEETLENEHARFRNAARLIELSQSALGTLAGDDDSLTTRAGQVGRSLQELGRLDAGASHLVALHEAGMEALRELHHAVSHYADQVELDPGRLHELEQRLNLVHELRRKYGTRVADILAFAERARARLAQLESRAAELGRLDDGIARLDANLESGSRALSEARRQAAPRLRKAVESELRDLGFPKGVFGVELGRSEILQRSGRDTVEFQFAPNPGEPARMLRAIASSGEIARVMLALKSVLAGQDDIPVLVFDEVDANIGGETARVVGRKIHELGRNRQVLCITHQASVAALADAHFVVSKVGREGRTVSEIEPVTGDRRIAEFARMLGGGAAALQHAQALAGTRP